MIALPVAMEDSIDTRENETRVGIVTSRKVGPAVTRNLVRRRLREIHRLGRLDMKPGFWIVVDVRRAAAGASFAELQREWLRHGKKLSILRTS